MDDNEWNYLYGRRHQLIFKVQMNRHYQLQRQSWMEIAEGAIKVMSLVAGSVAFGKVSNPEVVQYLAALIFTGSAVSLVFNLGNRARDAAQRAGQWVSLLREIEAAGERRFSEEQIDAWCAKANEVEMSEPAANKWLLKRSFDATERMFQEKPGNVAEAGAS